MRFRSPRPGMRVRISSMPRAARSSTGYKAGVNTKLFLVLALVGCGDHGGGLDAQAQSAFDAAATDGAQAVDASELGAPDAAPADASSPDVLPASSDNHIHIYISNTCVMSVSPTEITVPPDQTAYFDWHNHSVDYPVD